jgi:hypothetical protein
MLSITAAALGIWVRMGIYCIDTCTASITNQDPLSGPGAYLLSLLVGAIFPVGAIATTVLVVVARQLAKRGRLFAGIVLTVGAYAAIHLMSVLTGGSVAFACLAIGVVIWAVVLHLTMRRDPIKRQDSGPVVPPISSS